MPNTVVALEALQWIGHMSGIYHNKSKNRKLDVCIMFYRRLLFIWEAKHKPNQTKYIAYRTCIVCGIRDSFILTKSTYINIYIYKYIFSYICVDSVDSGPPALIFNLISILRIFAMINNALMPKFTSKL